MSPYEVQAREKKAVAIAELLVVHHITAEMACGANDVLRNRLACIAGQKIPSNRTWERVIELIEVGTRLRERDAQPFAGLTEADVEEGVTCR